MPGEIIMYSSSLRKGDSSEYSLNPLARKFDSYPNYIYQTSEHSTSRRRLSSTGEASGDSTSTTTSGCSSYGEREDVSSEGRAESEETDREEQQQQQQQQPHGLVSEEERQAVECFFHGLKTQVFVCNSLANLYTRPSSQETDWQLCFTGIPVVLLDNGEARARNKRRIQIILAERGTCFMLWRDTIDNLTSYKVSGKAFHTMCLSSDHTTLIGISFDMAQAAHEMWTHIERLVACPENISLSIPGKKKKKEKKCVKPLPLPPKSHISQPCCFQHVTSVEVEDRCKYLSLQKFVASDCSSNRIRVMHPNIIEEI